ncbi:MAG: hypothetical protein R3Y04_06955 [Rikenellaceae bacterium]
MIKLNSAFEIKRSVIITSDEEREIEINGINIEVIPAWKWILGDF